MNERIEKITIVGGGTAGWLTAMTLNTLLTPRNGAPVKVTLIESPNIATIGVGEATIITLPRLMQLMEIDEGELIRRTNGAFKLGVRFDDWSLHAEAKPCTFYHPFNSPSEIAGWSPVYHFLKYGPRRAGGAL